MDDERPVLGWYWQYDRLYADEYATVDDAVRAIGTMSENGDAYPDCVEDADGNVVVADVEAAFYALIRPDRPTTPPRPNTHIVKIAHPADESVQGTAGWFHSEDEARAWVEGHRLASRMSVHQIRRG